MRKTIAVCIICKNEETLIGRALESIKWVDNIYILDTGSVDRTIEICKQYTENVFIDYVWADRFDEPQNLIKSRAKEDVIISLDSDEVMLSSESEVREAVEKMKDVLRVTMVSEGGDGAKNDFGFGRIFRNTPDIYWCQSIHKHLNIPGEGEPIGNIRIMYGYSPAHLNDIDRSLRMLESAVAHGSGLPRNLYYLGREYSYKGRYQECIDTLKTYIQKAHWLAEAADAYLIMAQAYEKLRMPAECATACLQAILINSNFKEAIEYMALISIPENKVQWERMARSANNQDVLWKRTETEPPTNTIFLSVHQDDEALFGAYTLMREKPLCIVVTQSFIQPQRGNVGCDAETRCNETIAAMEIIGCPVAFLGIRDTDLTEEILRERLRGFNPDKVYAPAIQGGNAQHDIVGKIAKELFGDRVVQYCTYTKTELYTTGNVEIKPTQNEIDIKIRMLNCYQSQWMLPSTAPHFEAVIGKSEWIM